MAVSGYITVFVMVPCIARKQTISMAIYRLISDRAGRYIRKLRYQRSKISLRIGRSDTLRLIFRTPMTLSMIVCLEWF